jgi:DNA-binding GntR family transcriptional regulator
MVNSTIGERIFELLKDRILSGMYKPGDRLLYGAIANELKVSHSPVKEALLGLESEGLVQTIPRKGAFVAKLSKQDIIEYTEIRVALEALAVELVCKKGVSESALNQLRRINKELEITIQEKDLDRCLLKDFEFHHAIVYLSGNKRLSDLINQLPLSNFSALLGIRSNMIAHGDKIVALHESIIQSLLARDAQETKSLLMKNILNPLMEILDKTEIT